VAFDKNGNIYVGNYGGTTVSVFAPGQTVPIATLTGLGEPYDLMFDGGGDLYVTNYTSNTVSIFSAAAISAALSSGTAAPTTTLNGLDGPKRMAFDRNGNLVVVNFVNNTVSMFSAAAISSALSSGTATPTTTLNGLNQPYDLLFDAAGNLYVNNYGAGTVSIFAPGKTTPTATLKGLLEPHFMVMDPSGDLYVSSDENNTVSTYSAAAISTAIANPSGFVMPTGTLTGLDDPYRMTFDTNGNLYVTNFGNNTVSVFAAGSTTPSATLTGMNGPWAPVFDTSGNLYVGNLNGTTVSEYSAASLSLALAPASVVTFLEDSNSTLYKLESNGSLYIQTQTVSWTQATPPTPPAQNSNTVQQIYPDSSGTAIDVLESNGYYYQYQPFGSVWTLLSAPQFVVTPNNPTAPIAGTTQPVTINVENTDVYYNGQAHTVIVTGYTGTADVSTTDGQAAGLPLNGQYSFAAGNDSATFSVIFKTAGSQTVTFADQAGDLASVAATATVSPAAIALFKVSPGVSNTATTVTASNFTPVPVAVTAYDAYGNIATGYNGTINVYSSDGQNIAGHAFAPADNGTYTYTNLYFTHAGGEMITVSDSLNSTINGSGSFSVSAAQADSVQSLLTPGTMTVPVLGTVGFKLILRDQFANLEATGGATPKFSVASGPDTAGNQNMPFTDNGDGTYNVTLNVGSTPGVDTIAVSWTDPSGTVQSASHPVVTIIPDATPPSVAFPTVSGPTSAPVASLAIQFSKPIKSGAFSLSNLLLTLNGVAVPLTGATLTGAKTGGGDDMNWTLGNLAALTVAGGNYQLSLVNPTSITDYAGNPLANGTSAQAETTWTNASAILQGGAGNDTYCIVVDPTMPTTDDVFINTNGSTPTYTIPQASVPQWSVTGAAGDKLTVDFSNGNPLTASGLTFAGPSATGGDALYIVGTSGDDTVTATPTQIVVDGTATINYSNVTYFGASLAGGGDMLNIAGASLKLQSAAGITNGTAVNITNNGALNLGGNTVIARSVSVVSGQITNGTLINASIGGGSLTTQQTTYLGGGLSGSGSVTWFGPGVAVLYGTNAYTGGTQVTGGTLLVTSPSAIPSGGDITVGNWGGSSTGGGGPTEGLGTPGLPQPTFTLVDASGVFNGSPFTAAVSIAGNRSGVDTTPAASLEGVSPTLTYYAGSSILGNGTSAAPTHPGTYTVVASFAGSANYSAATNAPLTFTISAATPTLNVIDAGGTYNGNPYAATVTAAGVVQGVDSTPAPTLQGVTPTLTYYNFANPLDTGSPVAPSAIGTYVVVASFPGSADYAQVVGTQAVTFTISASATVVPAGAATVPSADAAASVATAATSSLPPNGGTPAHGAPTAAAADAVFRRGLTRAGRGSASGPALPDFVDSIRRLPPAVIDALLAGYGR
jgi:hypothetical protein